MLAKVLISIVLLMALFNGHTVDAQADDIRLRFYLSPTQWVLYDRHNLRTIVNHPSFSSARDTVFYHYGFTQTESTDTVVEMANAYMFAGNVNFVLIYYLSAATNVITNTRELGGALADVYISLADNGYPVARIHLVGFSLGAQVQAFASRNVQERTNRELVIGRLTGLDPGQIPAALIPLVGRLGAADAAFVDSIHTEGVGFGDHLSIGHVFYMVNGGVAQPFCTSIINTIAQTCSHNFAATAWSESVRARTAIFPSLQCQSWNHFLANNCNNAAPIGNMGATTSRALRGSYFLRTNNNSPFSRPQAGP